ncbi:MAG: AAA family ATPase [Actinomycetaceae bacterium]|nr:AAA family ATPase [Actinomycetaceae bacterium]
MAEEQDFVDHAYCALDRQREYYAELLDRVRAQGGRGTPGQVSERDSFASHYEDNLLRLRNVENRLVLGRIDHTTGQHNHIGRMTLRDADDQIILTDWRAPQSEPFYQATAAHPGTVLRRRHIQTRFRDVISIEDELLTDSSDSEGLNLTGEGALIAAMNKARDGRMGDIVATIQGEQDRIIRSDINGILVVQGGPGTGKTAVALHRAAYLLYTYRERLARAGVLIIGPSPVFLRYIDQVLPALGESDVVSTTVDQLVPGVRATISESARVAEIKGRPIWATFAQRAVRRILQKPLDQTVIIEVNGKKLRLTPAMVADAQSRARRSRKPHNQARELYARKLVEQLASQLAQAQKLDLADNDFLYADIAESVDARREINLHWLPSSAQTLLERIYFFPELLQRIAPELSEAERELLWRERGSGFTEADIAIIDEIAEYVGEFQDDAERARQRAADRERAEHAAYVSETMQAMGLGAGVVNSEVLAERVYGGASVSSLAERAANDRTWTYGHVIVDEAQELSPMQWRMISRRNPARSMTVVGDLDQRPGGAPQGGWKRALGPLAQFHRVDELTISYRTPASILDRAQEAMHVAGYPVRPVRAVRDLADAYLAVDNADLSTDLVQQIATGCRFLDNEYGQQLGTLAVIAPIELLDKVSKIIGTAPELAAWSQDLRGSDVSSRIQLLDPRTSKGLEYDYVVVVEPARILEQGPGDLYVAMTRATRVLSVVSTGPLPLPLRPEATLRPDVS